MVIGAHPSGDSATRAVVDGALARSGIAQCSEPACTSWCTIGVAPADVKRANRVLQHELDLDPRVLLALQENEATELECMIVRALRRRIDVGAYDTPRRYCW